jgi:hypothetical protein
VRTDFECCASTGVNTPPMAKITDGGALAMMRSLSGQLLFKAISGDRTYVGWSLTDDLIHKPIWMLLKLQ